MEFKLDDKEGIKKILEQRVQENLSSKKPNGNKDTNQKIETEANNNSTINTNYILYSVVALLIIISFYLGVTLSSQQNVPNGNFITQEEYNLKTQELLNTINELKDSMQKKQDTTTTIQKEVAKIEQQPTKTLIKEPLEIKPVVNIKPVIETISENLYLDYEPIASEKDYNIFKCYEQRVGSFIIPDRCMENLSNFIDDNKDSATKFEIIGVVNDDDKVYLKSFFKENSTASMLDFAVMGLSRHRVVEATWKVKDILGDDSKISFVNYTINSKISRGFVIRAYK